MSLRVWLPLNGSLNNLGLEQISLSLLGSTEYTSNGKIGQAINITTDGQGVNLTNYLPILKTYQNYSMSAWIYMDSTATGHSSTIISSGNWNTAAGQTCFGLYSYSSGYTRLIVPNTTSWSAGISLGSNKVLINKWYHIAITYDGTKTIAYINGVYVGEYAGGGFGNSHNTNNVYIGSATYITCFTLKGKINDVRIYDHALSPKEVEEISKGLILHYKLDKNFNQLNNCYSYPTFNTTSSNGGWSHWAPSGSSGSFGQNTDLKYIYDKNNTYSHWFSCASTSTEYYLFYQSPAFDGGYRSIQFIIKEENSLPIVESICYPGWNARNGGAASNKWTSIIPLGDGFYLCKVEGVSQDGSNNLIGFSVKPGYKVYVSCGYCENNREICSDIFNQDDLTNIIDSSGYSNNATASNITNINDSPKYNISSVFNGSNSYVKVTNNSWNPQGMEQITLNIWAKATTWPNNGGRLLSCTETGGFNLEGGNSGYWRFPIHVYTNAEKTSTAYKYDSKEILISSLIPNEWNMITLVYDAATGTKTYINGELHHTYSNVSYGIHFNMNARLFLGCEANGASAYTPYFNGQMSDFRIYATALTAAQIKELYDTSMGIDSNGNIYAREVVE